jgi:hypothetical protein
MGANRPYMNYCFMVGDVSFIHFTCRAAKWNDKNNLQYKSRYTQQCLIQNGEVTQRGLFQKTCKNEMCWLHDMIEQLHYYHF